MRSHFSVFYILTAACALMPMRGRGQNDDDDPQKSFNPISVAAPIMIVPPDARASGMGDVGVATKPDINSQHWNAAKYAFIDHKLGASIAYSPWLRGLVNDVNIAYLSFFFKYSDIAAVAASLRYFSLGAMTIIDENAIMQSEASPYELAFDASWTRKFGDNFSFALTGRYIRSDLIGGVTGNASGSGGGYAMLPANSWAFDIGAYYVKPLGRDEEWAAGAQLSNLGSKVNYSNEASGYFLPMNMRLGGRYGLPIDEDNHISFALDFNKLLVPTPPKKDSVFNRSDVSVPVAVFKSFADAPFGIGEEIAEIQFGLGAEYIYRSTFFARTGYFHDSKRKGNRRYITFGAGMRYRFLNLDLSYYVPFTNNDPMANTVKFTLGMYFGEQGRTLTRSAEYERGSTRSRGAAARPAARTPRTPPPRRTPPPKREPPKKKGLEGLDLDLDAKTPDPAPAPSGESGGTGSTGGTEAGAAGAGN